jgi:hypothetical protein
MVVVLLRGFVNSKTGSLHLQMPSSSRAEKADENRNGGEKFSRSGADGDQNLQNRGQEGRFYEDVATRKPGGEPSGPPPGLITAMVVLEANSRVSLSR